MGIDMTLKKKNYAGPEIPNIVSAMHVNVFKVIIFTFFFF
jgi:hypothetical protein